jgi:hypothetical protein
MISQDFVMGLLSGVLLGIVLLAATAIALKGKDK